MITTLYNRYFQKSRSFLFPALGINRSIYPPTQTFISLDDEYIPEDRKLICLYNHVKSKDYSKFEEKVLISNPLYHSSIIYPGEPSLYIFDFSLYSIDWDLFLKGQYSLLSPAFKTAIKKYYGDKSAEYNYIETYLYPDKYYHVYSKLLDVSIDTISKTGQLCNPYDPEQEKLIFTKNNLESSLEKV